MITAEEIKGISDKINDKINNGIEYCSVYLDIYKIASEGEYELDLSFIKNDYQYDEYYDYDKKEYVRPDNMISYFKSKGFKVSWHECKSKVEFIISWSE